MFASARLDSDLPSPLSSVPEAGADLSPILRGERARVAPPGLGVVVRAALAFLAFAALGAFVFPAMAEPGLRLPPPAEALRLRGDVTARGDVLTLGDLLENAPSDLAARPMFRAPALGATGTIQARRIAEAVAALGLAALETGGRAQIVVQRAARRVAAAEIEAALKRGLEAGYALDPRTVSIRLDGEGPALLAPVDLAGEAKALDLAYDARSHRVTGLIALGDRQASLRVTGVVVEMREVAVLSRALNRGETVKEGDVGLERRPREGLPADTQGVVAAVLGEAAQRALPAGTVLRTADTAPPELVARNEAVTIVYEAPGISLSMRGVAGDSGRLGATVAVTNVASKKILQATVIGPGRVSVGPTRGPQLQASAAALR
ncbi:flagellar basal body P-ring formation chaperone FlgA [Methylobacterium sp. NEAU 140]|uniref:flagellar basal body P-ring formation chaperone FlgA n=1 Tax=Methylobacterium sp. NEAU 140 TaxID=3064945 RepID=UPI0027346AD5|nr:flagellar basal body P-ring formation chaperone FlgA [Methylobacterium sp. NEAU 140]MDP4024559.1 flagellar basal body P-ring formation chaperone FlgA [Methylobacterium sp. NEAU 140]